MTFTRLPFSSVDWAAGAHSLEKKKSFADDPIIILEFAPGFADPNWCERGHIIHVLSGTLDLVLNERTEHIETGDACVLAPGTAHRAANPGSEPVRLFVVSFDD
jgi:quercetin dioxygenase-like cupin family protein